MGQAIELRVGQSIDYSLKHLKGGAAHLNQGSRRWLQWGVKIHELFSGSRPKIALKWHHPLPHKIWQ